MSSELKLWTDWLRANKLSLNQSKTKILIFRPPRKLNITGPNFKLNNSILAPKKTVTYLGSEIDENLFWKSKQKLIRTNNILLKLIYYVTKKNNFDSLQFFPILYIACVSAIWSFMSQKKYEEDFLFYTKNV